MVRGRSEDGRYSYAAYGLRIGSSIAIGQLPPGGGPGDGPADILIDVASLGERLPGHGRWDTPFRQLRPGVIRFSSPGLITIEIRNGREIIVDPGPDADESFLRLTILGIGMGHLLHQRGFLVLHGSALAIGGGVVAFLGPVGGGKSTTAAGLYRRGHTLVADDIVGVRTSTTPPEVEAALPEFRLWPESATAVGYDPEHLERLSTYHEKRLQTDVGRLAAGPLPLRRIFVLETGDHLAVEELTRREALAQLLINSYSAASLLGGGGDEHIGRCQTVLDAIPFARLVRTQRLEDLDPLLDIVEQHLGVQVAT